MKKFTCLRMDAKMWMGIFLLLCTLPGLSNSLMCYTCLNLDCPGAPKTCADIRSFMVTELKSLYTFSSLPACPDVEDVTRWKFWQVEAQANNDFCRNEKGLGPICSLSRLKIITDVSNDEVIVSHATITGCAKYELMSSVSSFQRKHGNQKCASHVQNVTSKNLLYFSYEIETCPFPEYCNEDFCINPRKSIVLPFLPQKKDKSFDAGLTLLIIVIVVVLLLTALLSSWCQNPLNRPSNMSTRV